MAVIERSVGALTLFVAASAAHTLAGAPWGLLVALAFLNGNLFALVEARR